MGIADEPRKIDRRNPPHPSVENAAVRTAEAESKAASRHNRINMLWEYTQAFLAMLLVSATVYASLRYAPARETTASVTQVPETLKNATFVVIGFYFGRTNHTRPTPGDSGE